MKLKLILNFLVITKDDKATQWFYCGTKSCMLIRNEKLVFLVSTLCFGQRSYMILCAETDVCRKKNLINIIIILFTGMRSSFASFNKFEIIGHIIRRVYLGDKRFDDECRLAYIRVLHSWRILWHATSIYIVPLLSSKRKFCK